MTYTNSSLVSYTRLSPNHSGQRTHAIDRITPHCVVGQCSVETRVFDNRLQVFFKAGIDIDITRE